MLLKISASMGMPIGNLARKPFIKALSELAVAVV